MNTSIAIAAHDFNKLGANCKSGERKACAELVRLATRDKSIQVRLDAVERIDDPNSLDDVARANFQADQLGCRVCARVAEYADDKAERYRRQVEDHAFRLAQQTATTEAYALFTKNFPKNSHGDEIAWFTAEKQNSYQSYAKYLELGIFAAVTGKHTAEALEHLQRTAPTEVLLLDSTTLAIRATELRESIAPFLVTEVYDKVVEASNMNTRQGASSTMLFEASDKGSLQAFTNSAKVVGRLGKGAILDGLLIDRNDPLGFANFLFFGKDNIPYLGIVLVDGKRYTFTGSGLGTVPRLP